MNIGIVGGRDFKDYEKLSFTLDTFLKTISLQSVTIISGGAKGADTLAEKYARLKDLKIKIYKADWDSYGKKAGYLRNVEIVNNSDLLFAFWDGVSKGTQISINLAKKKNIKMIIIEYNKRG